MAEVLLYHHIQGLTDGVQAFADDLRQAGHTVHTPDLFDGRTFGSIEEGFGFAREAGLDAIQEKGFRRSRCRTGSSTPASPSASLAQRLAQTRAGARGALLMCSCLPVAEFGETWPEGVPVQIHGKEDDEFFDEDLPAARELAGATAAAELFVYPGDQHLFADSSLDAYDPEAAALLMERVLAFLASV